MIVVNKKIKVKKLQLRSVSLVRLFSFFFSLYLSIGAINLTFTTVFPELSGRLMTMLYIFTFACMACITLIALPNSNHKISAGPIYLLLVLILLFLISSMFGPKMSVSFPMFVLLTLFPIAIPLMGKLNAKIVLFWGMVFSFPAVIFSDVIFITSGAHNTISMGTSYAFLFSIMASILYFLLYFKDDKGTRRVVAIMLGMSNAYLLWKILQFGSRGPIAATACLVAFLICFQYDKDQKKIRIAGRKTAVLVLVSFILLLNIWSIMEIAVEILARYDLQINIFNKMIRLNEQHNLFNGREINVNAAMIGIRKNPIIGNGMASYQYYTGYPYPHNLILQLMYDGGIILTLLVMVPVIIAGRNWYRRCNISDYALVVLTLFSGVFPSFFSGDIWTSELLWVCFSILLTHSAKKKKGVQNVERSYHLP